MVQLKLKNPILHFTSFNVLKSIIKGLSGKVLGMFFCFMVFCIFAL